MVLTATGRERLDDLAAGCARSSAAAWSAWRTIARSRRWTTRIGSGRRSRRSPRWAGMSCALCEGEAGRGQPGAARPDEAHAPASVAEAEPRPTRAGALRPERGPCARGSAGRTEAARSPREAEACRPPLAHSAAVAGTGLGSWTTMSLVRMGASATVGTVQVGGGVARTCRPNRSMRVPLSCTNSSAPACCGGAGRGTRSRSLLRRCRGRSRYRTVASRALDLRRAGWPARSGR